MGRLIIVRHGQASYGEEDYDRLSERGVLQCRMLGRYWAQRGLQVDEVYVGPRKRHWQSHDAILSELRLPEPHNDPDLDEYQAFEVMDRYAPDHKDLLENTEDGRRRYFLLYRQTMRRWIAGEFPSDGIENWQAFRRRVESSVERMRRLLHNGANTVLAITSGGPTGAAIGYALGLDDLRTMEQSWIVSNASFSEFLVTRNEDEDRFSVLSFNAVPHLDPQMITGA